MNECKWTDDCWRVNPERPECCKHSPSVTYVSWLPNSFTQRSSIRRKSNQIKVPVPIPGLFGTAVTNNKKASPIGSSDLHYVLTVSPENIGTLPRAAKVILHGYGPNNDLAGFISPRLDAWGAPGQYIYKTTFDLSGCDPSTASITFKFNYDNHIDDVLLNGASTGIHDPNTATPPISAGFVSGINTLEFLVTNDGGPTGVRVEITSLVTPL